MAYGRDGKRQSRMVVACVAGGVALVAAACSGASATSTSTVTTTKTAGSPGSRPPALAKSRTAPPKLGALLTYGYGNSRSDHDTVDPTIKNLSSSPAWNDTLDGAVYGQPLVYDARVYVGTESDTVYALSAQTGAVIWKVQVGTSVSTSVVDTAPTLGNGCGDIDPLGITGTPVIDTATNTIFAAEETEVGGNTWQHIQHWLVAVSMVTHKEVWHRQIDPPDGNQANHYYVAAEQQRPALTLYNNHIYAEYGGLAGDCGQYHGYVVELPESGSGALLSYQVPTQREGGIWGTGGAFESGGDLYVATGNGSSNSISDFDEGNSVIELSATTLKRIAFWAPSNWVTLNDADWDLGSAGPIEVPNSTLLFVAGKPGTKGSFGDIMRIGHLGGIGHGAFEGGVCTSGGAYGADATDVVGGHVYVYAPCGGGTAAVEVNTAAMTFKRVWIPSTGSPNGPPVVAGDLVWALNWNGNGLYGMNPTNGHVEIQRNTDNLNHFATPGIGDARVFVPTANGVEAWTTSG